jgi:hypothetical protein
MTMEKKITSQQQLLLARQEALRVERENSLRALGKMWGMDVFTWVDPYPGSISSTIHAFPFSVIWLAKKEDVMSTFLEDDSIVDQISAVVLYDTNAFSFEGHWLDKVSNVAGTGSVQEGIELIKSLKAPQTILLFSTSGSYKNEHRTDFETYVKMTQGI